MKIEQCLINNPNERRKSSGNQTQKVSLIFKYSTSTLLGDTANNNFKHFFSPLYESCPTVCFKRAIVPQNNLFYSTHWHSLSLTENPHLLSALQLPLTGLSKGRELLWTIVLSSWVPLSSLPSRSSGLAAEPRHTQFCPTCSLQLLLCIHLCVFACQREVGMGAFPPRSPHLVLHKRMRYGINCPVTTVVLCICFSLFTPLELGS